MAKIIFLDVDGILNIHSESYYTRTLDKNDESRTIEEHLVKRLMWILEQTGAVIVVSSSWRLNMDELQRDMEDAGFTMWNLVIGKTPRIRWRGDEIEDWISHHTDIENYVVLEDEIIDVCGEYCNAIPPENVVEIDMETGITHATAMKAVEILTKKGK